jgi:hypothetical protein
MRSNQKNIQQNNQIVTMPEGKGTYGRKRGRPPTKKNMKRKSC